jgi:hypothetical protein
MRLGFLVGWAVASFATAAPLRGQDKQDQDTWQLEGLRSGFCVQLLLNPASELLQDLPKGHHAVRASDAANLHVSLRSVIESQPEFAGWSPSQICFTTVDTIRTKDFSLKDGSGKHPQLFVLWTVLATGPSGGPQDVALDLFANSDRLIRSARLAGQELHEAKVAIGKVPAEDENGVPSKEDRFQVKLGGTTMTWDGHLAGDSVSASKPVEIRWAASGERGAVVTGALTWRPVYSRAMAGSLTIDGDKALAKALRASPTRFAGPAYRGGGGAVVLAH